VVDDLFLLRPGALGDTLLLAPALAAVRERQPTTRITLAGHHGAARLLAESGLVDLALSRDDPRLAPLFGASGEVGACREVLGHVDAAVAWLGDPEGIVAANLRRLGAGQTCVVPSQPQATSGRHVAEHLADALRSLGLAGDRLPLPPLLVSPPAEEDRVDAFLGSRIREGTILVAVHPGSGGRRKNWSPAGFAAVIDALASAAAVVLVGGPADEEAVDAVLGQARSRPLLATDLPLPRVATLIARCNAFLGNDSGLSHLAALLGVPTVALFGPTDPALWRPWGPRTQVLSWAAGAGSLSPDRVTAAVSGALAR
jgi:ADP-heptose:LPS heptosyltransferase